MVKILFINSRNTFSEVENRYPPLWPAYLSAYVEKKIGKENFKFRYQIKNIDKEIKNFNPDIIAISSVSQNYGYAQEYAKIAKKYNIPVIIGGIHITSLPETLSKEMDIGCIGEGEETFYELMKHFISNNNKFDYKKLDTIDGLIFHRDNKLVRTAKREPMESLDDLPFPDREVIGYKYRGYVYTARGCAYKCVFCICTKYWGNIRYAKPERVIEELKEFVRNGTKVVRFADENFVGNTKRLKEICELVVKEGLNKKLKFSCWCRANNVTQDIVDILKKMNVVSVKLGLESGSQRVLDYLKGSVKVEDNIRAVTLLNKAKIQINADFIIGSPDETLSEIRETYDFIKKMPLNFIDINIFSAYPGTPVWENALKKGIVSNNIDWSLINIKFDKTKKSCIWLCETLNFKELYKEFKKLQRLRLYKSVKSIARSPWLNEIPGVAFRILFERVTNILVKTKKKVIN